MTKTLCFPLCAALVFLFSCNSANSPDEKMEPSSAAVADTLPAATKTDYKTGTGKVITVSESHPQGASLSNIAVSFAGEPSSEVKFTDAEPIAKVMLGDLDANGFDEIYIVTVSAGTGSYGNVIGLASNSDKSLSMIYLPPIEEKDLKKGGSFEGYEGHDEFEIVENSLSRRFPIKAAHATMRSINYKMKAGEAGFVLYIKNSTAF